MEQAPQMTEAGGDDAVCEVAITATDANWLRSFTRALVLDHVAARCHNFQVVHTTFMDGDEVQEDQEARVHLHTRRSLVEHIAQLVTGAGRSALPCVLALPVCGGDSAYLAWVLEQTAAPTLRRPPAAGRAAD